MSLERGQRSSAGARPADGRDIAEIVSKQRHREIVKRRHHDATRLAGATLAPILADHLDQHIFRLHVVQARLGTLQRDVADFVGRIQIGERHAPGRRDKVAQILRQAFRIRAHLAQPRQRQAALLAPCDQRPKVRRMGQQHLRPLGDQPVQLGVEIFARVEGDTRAAVVALVGVAPGRALLALRTDTDGGQLAFQIATVPQGISHRHGSPEQERELCLGDFQGSARGAAGLAAADGAMRRGNTSRHQGLTRLLRVDTRQDRQGGPPVGAGTVAGRVQADAPKDRLGVGMRRERVDLTTLELSDSIGGPAFALAEMGLQRFQGRREP